MRFNPSLLAEASLGTKHLGKQDDPSQRLNAASLPTSSPTQIDDQYPSRLSAPECLPGSDQDPDVRFSDQWGDLSVGEVVNESLRRMKPVEPEYEYVSIPGLFFQANASDTEADILEEPKLGDFWDGKVSVQSYQRVRLIQLQKIEQEDLRRIKDPATTLQDIHCESIRPCKKSKRLI